MQTQHLGSILSITAFALATAGCATTTHEASTAFESAAQPELVAVPATTTTAADPTIAAEPTTVPATTADAPNFEAPPAAPPKPLEKGSWRIGGGSSAFFQTSDLGQGDQTNIGLGVTGGKMVSDQLMIEGLFDYSYSKLEANNGAELDSSKFDLGAGARYYFRVDGKTKPYARAYLGYTFADNDLGPGNGNDSDNAPFIGIGAGAETFFTDHFSLEYGLRLQQAFDLYNEDVTDFGLFVGLAIWF